MRIKRHKKLSDDKPTGFCFWCGKKLDRKGKKYCSSNWKRDNITRNNLQKGETCQEKYYRHNYSAHFYRWIYDLRNNQCEICGKECKEYMPNHFSKDEHAIHHKIPLYDGGELFNPENVILLCHDHHKEAHRLYRLFKKLLIFLKIEWKGIERE